MAAFFQFNDQSKQFGEIHIQCHPGVAITIRENWQDCIHVQLDGDELYQACKILGREAPFRVFSFINHDAQMICANWK